MMRFISLLIFVMLAAPALGSTVAGGSITGGVMRTASPGGGGPPVANCNYGTDCLCNTIFDAYPGQIVGCEDFEDPNLAGIGGPGGWDAKYPGADGFQCQVDDGGPTSHTGFVEDPAAVSEGKACLHHAYETSCEVSGETDCVEDGSGGSYSLQFRYELGENYGITGEFDFIGGRQTTLGYTMLLKFSDNFQLWGGPAAKMNEIGDSDSAFMGASNYHSACSPEIPAEYPFGGGFFTGGAPPGGSPTVRVGAACAVSAIGTFFGVSAAQYDWGTTFGPGEWGCFQGKFEPASGSYIRYRIWFTPVGGSATLIFDADIDRANLIGSDSTGFQLMSWNHYFNGPSTEARPLGAGWFSSDVGARWEDNWVWTNTDPVPCNAVSSSFPAP